MKQIFALVLLLPTLAAAQDASSTTAPASPQTLPARAGVLTSDEIAKLAAVRQQVLQQHPDLVQARNAYYNRLVMNQDAYTPDPSIQQGLAQIQASIEEAMKQLDPTVTPLLAKFHSAGVRWGGGYAQTVPPAQSTPAYSSAPTGTVQSHPEQVDIPPGG